MTNNVHYIAQQLKNIVGYMESHILYTRNQVTDKEIDNIIRKLNLVEEVTHLPRTLMIRLIIRTFHYGVWWYDEEVDNSESDKILFCRDLKDLVDLYWYNIIDHHDQFCMPATSEVMDLVEQEIHRYNKK